jgi:hypothetical protein
MLATTERSQTYGLVERQNAVIMDKLMAFVDKKESWDEGLQISVFNQHRRPYSHEILSVRSRIWIPGTPTSQN